METTDIWFAAFLRINGYKLSGCKKKERGKGSYIFTMTEEEWTTEKTNFYNSEINRVKQETIALKDLLF